MSSVSWWTSMPADRRVIVSRASSHDDLPRSPKPPFRTREAKRNGAPNQLTVESELQDRFGPMRRAGITSGTAANRSTINADQLRRLRLWKAKKKTRHFARICQRNSRVFHRTLCANHHHLLLLFFLIRRHMRGSGDRKPISNFPSAKRPSSATSNQAP